jgi:hypothetical protein
VRIGCSGSGARRFDELVRELLHLFVALVADD